MRINLQLVSFFTFFSHLASIVVIFVGCLVFIGWLVDVASHRVNVTNLITIREVTAFTFILSGLSLWLFSQVQLKKVPFYLVQICACVPIAIGTISLVKYLTWLNWLGEFFLLNELKSVINLVALSMVEPYVAINLVLVGFSLVVLNIETVKGNRPSEFLALLAIFISLISFIGYTFGIASFRFLQIDPQTSITFVVLCLGVLFAEPQRGLIGIVTSNYAGGFMMRRLLFAIISVSLLTSIMRLVRDYTGILSDQLGIIIIALLSFLAFGVLIIGAARSLETIDSMRRRAEGEIQQLNRELEGRVADRTAELGEANKKLEAAMKSLSYHAAELTRSNEELEQFAYAASHDLQEPLCTVASYIKLLERRYKDKLDDKGCEFINCAVDGIDRMQILINDLLRYSRIGTTPKSLTLTDCNTVVESVVRSLQQSIKQSNATVTHGPLPEIVVDSAHLTQLFQNLISNAIKFHDRELPHVHVSAVQNHNEWIFSVQDNGIGIDPVHTERIFVIFERLHSEVHYPGTGIGLAICKKIVEEHGGRIWVESQVHKGSTFYFTIPMLEQAKT